MTFISNRDALIVRPTKAFFGFISSIDGQFMDEKEFLANTSVYLIEEMEDCSQEAVQKYVEILCPEIIIQEIFGWYEDDEIIPEKLDFALFSEWFMWEHTDLVHDAGRGNI